MGNEERLWVPRHALVPALAHAVPPHIGNGLAVFALLALFAAGSCGDPRAVGREAPRPFARALDLFGDTAAGTRALAIARALDLFGDTAAGTRALAIAGHDTGLWAMGNSRKRGKQKGEEKL